MAVYFLLNLDNGLVKIGYSYSPESRATTIKREMGIEVKLLGIIEGGQKEELQMHYRFRDFHHHGEWFLYSAEIREFIKGNCTMPLTRSQMYTYRQKLAWEQFLKDAPAIWEQVYSKNDTD